MYVFLFTDIEASTRLWETYPDLMGRALARHDVILHEAVVGGGGSVVKSTGDGLMATFPDVAGCLSACASAQRSLADEPWATPEPVRVRMGVHVGDAEARAGDYFGTAVNRAARIMSAGHGGQVLVSHEVAALAGRAATNLDDLGLHRLKDLAEAAHLYQLSPPGLPNEFPPLATLDGTPNNLPFQVSEFVGREDVLAAAKDLLGRESVRLVTLLGPGGTGKTRLSLQLAADRLEAYPDGVHFVDLSDEVDPDAAFEAIIRELGLTGAREGSPLQVLKARLREGRRLLVLDNLEQVTHLGSGILDLLAFCPGLEVVTTSREILAVRGEHVFEVPTLGVAEPGADFDAIASSEAVRLFVDRARAVRPDFDLDATTAPSVARVTQSLDGLPLAIELAAARLQVFSVDELARRVGERLDVIGSGQRDLPSRQRTLEGMVDWSYGLLSADERAVFEVISVFVSARFEEIEAVVGAMDPHLDVLDSIASLTAKSLVRRVDDDGGSRFSMLRVIRDDAARRLAADPAREQAVLAAHAAAYVRLAVRVGAGAAGTPPALLAEMGNLLSAWRYLVDNDAAEAVSELYELLWTVAESQGWYSMAIDLNEDLLRLRDVGASVDELDVRVRLARSLMAVGGYSVAVQEHFERALALMAAEDSRRRGPVLRALATYHMNADDMEASARLGQELVDLGEQDGDEAAAIEGHVVLGAVTLDFATAIRHFEDAVALSDRLAPSSRFRQGALPGVIARMAGAHLLGQVGRVGDAVGWIEEGLALARRVDHPFSLAYALHHAAFFWIQRARYEGAAALATELTSFSRRHGYTVWLALGAITEGVARAGLGGGAEAMAVSASGLELYEELSTPPVFWVPLQILRATGFIEAGLLDEAVAVLSEVADFPGVDAFYPDLARLLGEATSALGNRDDALGWYRRAADGARISGARLVELRAEERLLALGAGDQDRLSVLHDLLAEHAADEPAMLAVAAALGR